MRRFAAIDIFSGCGGLSLGLEQAGFEVKVAVELDPLAAKTYRKNHSATIVVEADIRKVSAKDLMEAAGICRRELDLLAGCPPCQGFSRIKCRNRPGSSDLRNDLIFDFLRIARDILPKVILLENVPGLGDDWRFARMVRSLRRMGYACQWSILNAADFGVPQRRNRLILMASRIGEITMPTGHGVRKSVRDAIGGLDPPHRAADRLQRMHQKNTLRIKRMISRIPKNGGSRVAWGPRAQLACHKRAQGFRDVYGRMRWDDVSPTVTGGCFNPSKGRFLHPQQNRALTLREAALLQSFPRAYRFPKESGITAIARMIGDALPPAFAKAQALHLRRHLASAEQ